MSGIINGKVESLYSKSSYLEEKCLVEEKSSGKASCLENSRGCKEDIMPLKLVGRFSVSDTHSHNREVCESFPSNHTEDKDIPPVCRTPTESKFDSFSPGPENLTLARKRKDSNAPLRQVLHYDLSSDSEEIVETDVTEDFDAEECFSELIFSSLLELIISTKLMEISVNNRATESEECKTPTSLPFLTGIAETCPPAPRRPTLFAKKLDHDICRKLKFESSLN